MSYDDWKTTDPTELGSDPDDERIDEPEYYPDDHPVNVEWANATIELAAKRFAAGVMRPAIAAGLDEIYRGAGEIRELALQAEIGREGDLSRIAAAASMLRGKIAHLQETTRRNCAEVATPGTDRSFR